MCAISINNNSIISNSVGKKYQNKCNNYMHSTSQGACDTVSFSGKANKPIALILAMVTPFIAGRALAENRNVPKSVKNKAEITEMNSSKSVVEPTYTPTTLPDPTPTRSSECWLLESTPTPSSECRPLPKPMEDFIPVPVQVEDCWEEEAPALTSKGNKSDETSTTKTDKNDSNTYKILTTEAPVMKEEILSELSTSEENKSDETSTTKADNWEGLKPYLMGIAVGVPTGVAIDSVGHAIKTTKKAKQEEEEQSKYINRL